MHTVNATFLNTVGTDFLTEAGRIRGHGNGKACFVYNLTLELTNHGMFGSTNQIKVFAFNLVHHGFHFVKAHNAVYHAASNHERRNTIGKSLVNHEISCIADHCGMNSGSIAHQVIETVAAGSAGALFIKTVNSFQYICMIRYFKIGNLGLTESGNFHVLGIVLADRYGSVNNLGNFHHDCCNFFLIFRLFCFQFGKSPGLGSHFCLLCFCFFFFTLCHQSADFLGNLVLLCAKLVRFLLNFSALCIQSNYFVNKGKLCILEFLLDIFLY